MKRIIAGDKAIDFQRNDIYGNPINLSGLKGNKVLLAFFRNVHCPFCNLRVHELSKNREALEAKGLRMIFFFESSEDHLKRSIFHQEVSPVPLISDPKREIYAQYGVGSSTLKMMSTFLKSGTFGKMKEGMNFELPEEKEKGVDMTLIPADFLIDEQGVVQVANYGNNVRDHIPLSEIKSFVGLN